jgi:hypothetical protein
MRTIAAAAALGCSTTLGFAVAFGAAAGTGSAALLLEAAGGGDAGAAAPAADAAGSGAVAVVSGLLSLAQAASPKATSRTDNANRILFIDSPSFRERVGYFDCDEGISNLHATEVGAHCR